MRDAVFLALLAALLAVGCGGSPGKPASADVVQAAPAVYQDPPSFDAGISV